MHGKGPPREPSPGNASAGAGPQARRGADHRGGGALEILERKWRTSETERRRVLDQERTITQAQAMSFVAGMVAVMREALVGEPNEQEVLARIHAGVARLVARYVSGNAVSRADLDS